jgi:RimJ/RimL family protein N-acetyltransferase
VSNLLKLVGKQVVLRDWKLEDIEVWMRWMTPGQAWQELDAPYFPQPPEEKIAEWHEKLQLGIQTSEWPTPRANLPICLRSSDQLIGRVSWYWRERSTAWRSIGIDIYDPSYWQQGIGYEALGMWIDYLFETLPGARRLDLGTWSGNIGMMRLAAKLGFLEEARFRKARIVRGKEYDSLGFGILREEWEAHYPNGFGSQLL